MLMSTGGYRVSSAYRHVERSHCHKWLFIASYSRATVREVIKKLLADVPCVARFACAMCHCVEFTDALHNHCSSQTPDRHVHMSANNSSNRVSYSSNTLAQIVTCVDCGDLCRHVQTDYSSSLCIFAWRQRLIMDIHMMTMTSFADSPCNHQ